VEKSASYGLGNTVYFVTLYMFRAYLGPSSGGTTVCIWQLVLILFRSLSVVLDGLIQPGRLYLLMMGLDTPKTCRGWWNVLRISCASSWFLFTRLYGDARSTKPKIGVCVLVCKQQWQCYWDCLHCFSLLGLWHPLQKYLSVTT